MLHLPLGSMPHGQVLRAIELFGTQCGAQNTCLLCHERGVIKKIQSVESIGEEHPWIQQQVEVVQGVEHTI